MKRNNKFLIYILIIYLVMLLAALILLFPTVSQNINEMFRYNTEMLLLLFVFLIMIITITVTMLYVILYKRNQEEDKHIGNSELPNERKYLEREIVSLNQKLVASEERWNTAFHLLISSQNNQKSTNGVISTTAFLKGFGIDIEKLTIKNNEAFVLTPFHSDFDHTYEVIKKSCMEVKMTAVRSDDEEYVKSDILKYIIKTMVEARVIIANLNGRNANVFYELGIAHSLNKPTILISEMDKGIPFDIQGHFLILYDSDVMLNKKLKEALLKILTGDIND